MQNIIVTNYVYYLCNLFILFVFKLIAIFYKNCIVLFMLSNYIFSYTFTTLFFYVIYIINHISALFFI